jgi:hypothetical protein
VGVDLSTGTAVQHPLFGSSSASPRLIEAFEVWDRLRGGRLGPARREVDPAAFRALLANLVLFDVLDDPLDFRYRLIGTGVRERIRRNLTGQRLSEIEYQKPGTPIFADYARVVENRKPLFGDVDYVGPDRRIRAVQHLLMPLSDDGDRVTGILTFIDYVLKRRG